MHKFCPSCVEGRKEEDLWWDSSVEFEDALERSMVIVVSLTYGGLPVEEFVCCTTRFEHKLPCQTSSILLLFLLGESDFGLKESPPDY